MEATALQLFEKGLTKTDLKLMAANAVDSVLESGNVLQVAEALSAMMEFVESVKKDQQFIDYAREEAGKHPKGFTSNSGAKIELAEVGTKYDFSQCMDPELAALEIEMISLKEKIDTRQKFLKALPTAGISILNEDTGELIQIFPPSKTSTSSYKITLAK